MKQLNSAKLAEDTTTVEKSWDKATIRFVTANRTQIMKQIRNGIKTYNNKYVREDFADDIFQEVLIYFFNHEDYNFDKALSKSTGEGVIGVDGYVYKCIDFQIKAYMNKELSTVKDRVDNEVGKDENGKTLSIFDTETDTSNYLCMPPKHRNMDEICRNLEYARYNYGVDFYLVWYIMLLTNEYGKKDRYLDILSALDINKASIEELMSNKDDLGVMNDIASAIGDDTVGAINVLRRYVYGCDTIERVIKEL